MNLNPLAIVAVALMLVACGDGPPRVDPERPVVDGKPMTHIEYLSAYCTDKQADPMCVEVTRAMSRASTTGELPKGW